MSCTNPIKSWVSSHVHPSGKTKFVFTPEQSVDGIIVYLPCQSCDSCVSMITAIKGWRSMLEASQNEDNNTYVTLTYDQENLPQDLSLHHAHWQAFIRAVRDKERRDAKKEKRRPATIKFSMCGEYGQATAKNNYIARPHFHAILYNYQFEDLEPADSNEYGQILYNSKSCESLWDRGNIKIGDVTSASANYVARHNEKKINNDKQRILIDAEGKRYMLIWNSLTGKRGRVKPEYTQSSNRPGIGKTWYDKYKSDIYEVHPRGLISCGYYADFPQLKPKQHYRLPGRYFDKLYERENPAAMAEIKAARIVEAKAQAADNTHERLETKAMLASKRRERNAKHKL